MLRLLLLWWQWRIILCSFRRNFRFKRFLIIWLLNVIEAALHWKSLVWCALRLRLMHAWLSLTLNLNSSRCGLRLRLKLRLSIIATLALCLTQFTLNATYKINN
jgi:hypothetical protein